MTISMNLTRFAPALVALALAACSGDAPERATRDSAAGADAQIVLAPQDLATAVTRPIGAEVIVSGNLDPADVVQVRAQVPGTVQNVRVDRGTRVARGAPLATIEAQGIRSQAAGAKAQVDAARANAAVARQRLEGAKRLYDAGAISAIEYRTAEANLQAAEAQVAVAEAAAAGAGESAARATITSPIDGVVSARSVSGGEAVSPGAALFTIVNASELELAGRVSVQDAARVRAGQPVTFSLDAFPNQTFSGRVARVDPTADPGTRQVGVYVRLPNPGERIVGGQYARGRIETGRSETSVVIPETALTGRSGDSASVFVLSGNRVAQRIVTLGPRDESTGLIAVRSGLREGERVLINPSSDIGDGTVVSVAADVPKSTKPDTAR